MESCARTTSRTAGSAIRARRAAASASLVVSPETPAVTTDTPTLVRAMAAVATDASCGRSGSSVRMPGNTRSCPCTRTLMPVCPASIARTPVVMSSVLARVSATASVLLQVARCPTSSRRRVRGVGRVRVARSAATRRGLRRVVTGEGATWRSDVTKRGHPARVSACRARRKGRPGVRVSRMATTRGAGCGVSCQAKGATWRSGVTNGGHSARVAACRARRREPPPVRVSRMISALGPVRRDPSRA